MLEDEASADRPLKDQIEQALRKLPAEQREVIVLKFYHGFTFREIGELTGCSPNTAASRYRYATEALEKLLAEWKNS